MKMKWRIVTHTAPPDQAAHALTVAALAGGQSAAFGEDGVTRLLAHHVNTLKSEPCAFLTVVLSMCIQKQLQAQAGTCCGVDTADMLMPVQMGLGKTVELLACLLAHPFTPSGQPQLLKPEPGSNKVCL